MDKKTVSLFSFFLLFLMAISIASAVEYTNNITEKASDTEYNTQNGYGFQINCTESGKLDVGDEGGVNASFTLGRPDGTSTTYENHTASVIEVYNISMNIWYINFTNSTGTAHHGNSTLTAGTYNYSWTCMNMTSVTELNSTATVPYVIAKNTTGTGVNTTITVYTHGGTSASYVNSIAQSVEGQGNPYADCTIRHISDSLEGSTNLWRDGVAWTEGSGGATSLGVGSYTTKCNLTGNANYTNNNTGQSYALSVIAAGGGGGGGGSDVLPTTTTPWTWTPPTTDGWQLPEINTTTVVVILIIIAVLASQKKKRK